MVLYLAMADLRQLDPAARIVPAIFFQPHFHNYHCTLGANDQDRAVLDSPEYQELRDLPPSRASSTSRPSPPCAGPPPPPGRRCDLCSIRWMSGSREKSR